MGPAWNGRAYIDGDGTPPAGVYLNALWLVSGRGLPKALAAAVPPSAYPGSKGYIAVKPVTAVKVRAQIAAWGVSAVVAVTTRDTVLGRYLTALLGAPAAGSGDVLGWRILRSNS